MRPVPDALACDLYLKSGRRCSRRALWTMSSIEAKMYRQLCQQHKRRLALKWSDAVANNLVQVRKIGQPLEAVVLG